MEEAKRSRVEVHSKLSIVSSKPTMPARVHKLSPLDQAMELHSIHLVFYYRSNPFNDGKMPSDVENLRVSLSDLLNDYAEVAGRLTRGPDGEWQVKCNDAGVRMLQASVSASLDEWMRSADADEERDLTVWEDMPEDPTFWSPFRIQINNFQCGGLAIGFSGPHMEADITSATLLMKSWAEFHRGLSPKHPPVFDLPLPPSSQDDDIPSFSASTSATTPAKLGTVVVKFPGPVIRKCLSQVQSQCPDATPFDVLAALFWSCIARFQEPSPEDHRRSLVICLDARNHGHPAIPYGYFGNALHFSVLSMDVDNLLGGGLAQVSDHVHSHVAGIKREGFLRWPEGHHRNCKEGEGPFRMYGARLTCINTEHMIVAENGHGLMYDATFREKERPVLVSYHVGNVDGEGLIMVMPSPEGGLGRTVKVMLPEEQIAKLCKDQTILDLQPTFSSV